MVREAPVSRDGRDRDLRFGYGRELTPIGNLPSTEAPTTRLLRVSSIARVAFHSRWPFELEKDTQMLGTQAEARDQI